MFESEQTVYSVGAGLFGVCTIVTGAFFVRYVSKGWAETKTAGSSVGHAHWKKSLWMYLCMSASFFLLTFLYVENATGNGFRMKINMQVINPLRWIILGMIAVFYNGCLAFILTEEDDVVHPGERQPVRAQSVMTVLCHLVSATLFYFATISTSESEHWICIFFSFLSFVASVLLYFFPYNKMKLASNLAESYEKGYTIDANGIKKTDHTNVTPVESHTLVYRWVLLAFLIVAHVVTVIVWFISQSNDIIDPANGLDTLGEAIAYFVIDILAFIPFTIAVIVLIIKYHGATMLVIDPPVERQPLVEATYANNNGQFGPQFNAPMLRSMQGIAAVRDHTR